jgi:hypothetical protein
MLRFATLLAPSCNGVSERCICSETHHGTGRWWMLAARGQEKSQPDAK